MKRIGVYGGSFNPPHIGHILAAEQMCRLLQLDRLLIVPAYLPPHKQLPEGSPDSAGRLALCKKAFSMVPGAEVCDMEMMRQGTSYTVMTLRTLKQENPDAQLVLIMGTDMLLSFDRWYCRQEICKLASLAVMRRSCDRKNDASVQAQLEKIRTQLAGSVDCFDNDCVEISSTQTRNLIALDCMDGCVNDETAQLIRENHWYRWGTDWKQLPFEQLKEASVSLHLPQRVAHVLGCCETAKNLARRWGADETAAKRAGILHDVTKALNETQQLRFCKRYAILFTDFEQSNPTLLHAKTGAAAARYVFGESPEVCSAIYWHTTGHENMTLLEKIVYIADYMEPTRKFEGIDELRRLAYSDLNAALLLGFEMSLKLLKTNDKPIDPNSQSAWEYLKHERSAAT